LVLTTSGDLYLDSTGGELSIRINGTTLYEFDSNLFYPKVDNSKDLGHSGGRWKDLYLSSGVYLGGTVAANLLDDYEEGTWTPTIRGSVTSGTYTYVANEGAYTKVGRMVSLSFYITNISVSSAGSGYIQIIGLPFEKRSTHFPSGACALSDIDMNSSTTWATAEFISASATSILYVRTHGDNVAGAVNNHTPTGR
jgi:hypothetical protein